MTWQKKDNDKDKDKDIFWAHSNSDLRHLWPLRHLIRVMRTHELTKNKQWQRQMQRQWQRQRQIYLQEHLQRAIPETCDPWNIWSEWWGDMTHKITMTKKNKKTKKLTMTKTNTFKEHLQRATLKTCDLWEIWSEWWGDLTWPTKIQWKIQLQRQRKWQRQWQIQSQRLVPFETLIKIPTIENLNSWQYFLPDN